MIRTVAVEKNVSEISENDEFVSVIGTVVSVNPNDYTMLLDDGTGQTTVFADRVLEVGNVIRVIGKPFEKARGINADVLQDFSDIDITQLHRLRTLEAKR